METYMNRDELKKSIKLKISKIQINENPTNVIRRKSKKKFVQTETTGVCNACNIEKPLKEFRYRPERNYRVSQCLPCERRITLENRNNASEEKKESRKQTAKEYRINNIDKLREKDRNFKREKSLNADEEYLEKKRQSIRNHYANNKEYYLQRNSDRRAREANAEGSHTLQQWQEIQTQQVNRCKICNMECKLTKDHIIPLAKGGSHDISNIQGLCGSCNSGKGDRLI